MASLVTCPVCKKEHSDDVSRCPHCGAKYSKPFTKRPFAMIMAGAFGLIVFSCVSKMASVEPPSASTAIASKAATSPAARAELTAKFAAERGELMTQMNASLKTKDFYSVLGKANDYEGIADSEFRDLLKRVQAADKKTSEELLKKLAATELKEAKKKGVSVGMTKAQALASSWGKPRSVNTTTGTFGSHEQWVYGSRNYLYFENGILTTIQN